jgi:ferritin-like metal-binding protein YciE
MPDEALREQLTKYLTDAHSIEQQALAQMRVAPKLAGDQQLASAFAEHCTETEAHERTVRELLQSRGAGVAKLKDLLGTLTGKGFVGFARAQPDTPGKLVVHAYSYEHMELAAYELIAALADRVGDDRVAAAARTIGAQESSMAKRLSDHFDLAVTASLQGVARSDLGGRLDDYLADAHAIEAQSIELLSRAPRLAGVPELQDAYDEHRSESEQQQRRIDDRLQARGGSPSRIKDAALRLGALNWGVFFAAQPDTPVKLAAFAYSFEHLEIGSYELLLRVAQRAQDVETERIAERALVEERAAAERIHSLFAEALDASLALHA